MRDKKLFGSFMLYIASFIWGMSYSVQNILAEKLGMYTIIFIKSFGGVFLFFGLLITSKKFTKKTIIGGTLIGTVYAIANVFQQLGITNTAVSKASFITSLYIMFVPLIGLFTKKKPKPKFWISVLIACVGMYLLCMSGEFSLNIGDIYALIGAILFAIQIILIDRFVKGVEVVSFVAVQQLATSIISGSIMIAVEKPQLVDIKSVILPVLYVMLMSGLVAQLIQNRFQKDVEPSLASLIMSFESVFGAIGGWLLLNQALTLKEAIGCLMIFVAIIIAELK